jgi:hypothetical protein
MELKRRVKISIGAGALLLAWGHEHSGTRRYDR